MSKTDQCLLNWHLPPGASGPQLPALSGSVLASEGWALPSILATLRLLRTQGERGRWRACWGTRRKPGQQSVGGRCQLKRQRYHASLGWQASLYCGILTEASLGLGPRQQLSDDSLIKSCKRHLEGAWSRQNNAPPQMSTS